jgi:hypothetical protein
MNEDFAIKTNLNQLAPVNDGKVHPEYMQVSAQKANTGDSFPLGEQVYTWSVNGSKWWVPSRTHFVIRVTLEGGDGSLLGSGLDCAPTSGMLATLFQAIEFKMGGKSVQRIALNLPQIDALLHRTTKSGTYLSSLGEADDFWAESWTVRKAEVEAEVEDGSGRSAKQFDLIYRPSFALFHDDEGTAIPAGSEFQIILTPQPQSQYKLGVVESLIAGGDQPVLPADNNTGYAFIVDRCELYVATIDGPEFNSGSYVLALTNIEAQITKVQTASLSQYTFSVSPNTKALCVAYQDTRLQDGRIPRTKFVVAGTVGAGHDPRKVSNNRALQINRLFVSYDGVNRPQPDADMSYVAGTTNRTVQRYQESMAECSMTDNPAGPETLNEHLRRGAFYYFNYNRPENSGATRVQVNQQFNVGYDPTYTNVILFSISKTFATITVRNGVTVAVEQSMKR